MKKILIVFLMAQVFVVLTACQHTDDVPPVQKKYGTEYKMPEPKRLSSAERELLDSIAKEYNESINK